METLDLHIEHSVRVHLHTECVLNILCKTLLIALLDRGPLLAEGCILGILKQALKLCKLLEPRRLGYAKRVGNELGQAGVALVKPATRGNTYQTGSAEDRLHGLGGPYRW